MKAFIWNTEYEVIISLANSEGEAKYNLINSNYSTFTCMDGKLEEILKNSADTIVEENQCLIYDHGNE